ncbi:MAG: twin-arginine translocase TatA/TatE family subunit [Candidatus Moraniibacteriota bacterium]
MFGLGVQELILILVIVLLLFGGKKLPELARSIGQGMREIKKGFGNDDAPQDSRSSAPDQKM